MEYLLALLSVAALDRLIASHREREIALEEEALAWMTDIKDRMSDFQKAELSHFFASTEISLPIFSFALESLPFGATPGELIDCLREQPALPFLRRAKAIWQATQKGADDAGSRTWLAEEQHAQETKQRLVYLLDSVYAQLYSRQEEAIRAARQRATEQIQNIFAEDPMVFYTSYLSIDPQAFTGEACIHVSCFLQNSFFILQPQKPDTPTWIAIDRNRGKSLREFATEARQTALKFFKLMSDKTRFEMVQLLQQKRWYNEEMANHLGISAATANYHLAALLELEIVAMVREQHRMYYSLNRDKLRRLLGMAGDSLTGDRNANLGA